MTKVVSFCDNLKCTLGTSVTQALDTYPDGAGTVVYNTGDVLAKGLYVWDGDNWLAAAGTVLLPGTIEVGSNTYTTGYFGSAGWWMTENLREIPDTVSSPSTTTNNNARYWNYAGGNSSSVYARADSVAKYGLLYSWPAAINSNSGATANQGNSDHDIIRGICPVGWHLPSDKEWSQLEEELANSTTAYSTNTVATTTSTAYYTGTGSRGAAPTGSSLDMKMRAPVKIWTGTFASGSSKAANEGGFSALPAGNWSTAPSNLGTNAYFWSSSSNSSPNAWCRSVLAGTAGVRRDTYSKYTQFSVRCKKD